MRFASRRERRLWLAAGLYLLAIYATLGLARLPTELLRSRGLLAPAVTLLFALVAAGLAAWLWRRRPGRRELLVLAAAAGVYALVLAFMERPEERLHLLEYGLFAILVRLALRERHRGLGRPPARALPWLALALTAVAGWVDEGVQYLLPNRFYDLRDVAFNALAGVLALAAFAALERARRWSDRSPAGSQNA